MTRAQRSLYGCLVVFVCLILTSVGIQAQEEEAFIQYRQKVMASNGANMGAIAGWNSASVYQQAIAQIADAIDGD